eukprot:gene9518-401_t
MGCCVAGRGDAGAAEPAALPPSPATAASSPAVLLGTAAARPPPPPPPPPPQQQHGAGGAQTPQTPQTSQTPQAAAAVVAGGGGTAAPQHHRDPAAPGADGTAGRLPLYLRAPSGEVTAVDAPAGADVWQLKLLAAGVAGVSAAALSLRLGQDELGPDGAQLSDLGVGAEAEVQIAEPPEALPRLRGVVQGHVGRVHACALDGGGTRLLSGGADSGLMLWDVADLGSPALLLTLRHNDRVLGSIIRCDISRDGKLALSSCSADTCVKVWDVDTQARGGAEGSRLVTTLRGHSGKSYMVSTVRVWCTPTGDGLATLHHDMGVYSCAFSPGMDEIASGANDSIVRVWDWRRGLQGAAGSAVAQGRGASPRLALEGHGDSVWSIAYSGSGERLASASRDGRVILWDTAGGAKIFDTLAHRDGVHACVFIRGDQQLLSF